jgi:2-deoxy-D-gluconate 3-dehydrogenase
MSGLKGFTMDFFSLKGKTVFITGANTGLGQGYAVALAAAGADLFIVTYDREWAETEKLITDEGVKVKFFQADLTKKDQMTAAVSACLEEYGK